MFKSRPIGGLTALLLILLLAFVPGSLSAQAEGATPETAAVDQQNPVENSWRYRDGVPIYDEDTPALEWGDLIEIPAPLYNGKTYYGIDVSHHQGLIDWQQVKDAGVQFVMIRCGIGSEYDGIGENKQDDAYWEYNASSCERLGIPYGVYLYSYATNTDMAASEARHTLSLIAGHNPTLPIFLDLEDNNTTAKVDAYTLGSIAQTYCDMLQAAGYRTGIYSYRNFFNYYLTDSRFSNPSWYRWVADYSGSCNISGRVDMWQNSNSGIVNGINGRVDTDIWYGEFPSGSGSTVSPDPTPDPSVPANYTGWAWIGDKQYWYENSIRQGTTGRGKEIYDPASDAWYWLDAVQGGAMAVNKDVYQESNGGKWVRYDENGHMVKGEDYRYGAWYYFEPITGAMVKGPWTKDNGQKVFYDTTSGKMVYGSTFINGNTYYFSTSDGHLLSATGGNFWLTIDGNQYWYEDWVRQGWQPANAGYRGKEIFDPGTNAWYWLDNLQQGAKAVSRDVFQDSNGGKWVRYDGNGRMVKGWNYTTSGTYFFDWITGAMAKGWVMVDGNWFHFNEVTGVLM
ncbi:MAG: GH25 family lysozyme [Gemmiger sp.]|uniref:GH25 family lysozyme n=1 Tax=Gemmiger sp. TaxID=2049027 RepID=UPI002E78D97B|nr:GH25 family lysozyme [Gemmiger sp.]MEE0799753.1 GH25 family lysozyme [Gemmiger sp.]